MKIDKNLLISPNQEPKLSNVYIGYLILRELKSKDRLSIFDTYSIIKKSNKVFNYSSTISALIFLFINGLIEFDEPYIYKIVNSK